MPETVLAMTWLGVIILFSIILLTTLILYTLKTKYKRVVGEILRDIGLASLVGFIISATVTEIKTFWFLIPISIFLIVAGELIKELKNKK